MKINSLVQEAARATTMTHLLAVACCVIGAFLFSDCARDKYQESSATTVAKINSMGIRLFTYVSGEDNVVVSPVGAWIVYSILDNNSTDNNSASELEEILGVPEDARPDLNRINADLLSQLSSDGAEFSGLMWADSRRAEVQASALVLLSKSYGVRVRFVNYEAEPIVKEINQWIKSGTHGNVTSLIDRNLPRDYVPGFEAIDLITTLSSRGDLVDLQRSEVGHEVSASRAKVQGSNLTVYVFSARKRATLETFESSLTGRKLEGIVRNTSWKAGGAITNLNLRAKTHFGSFGYTRRWIIGAFGTHGQTGLQQSSVVRLVDGRISFSVITRYDGWNPNCCVDFAQWTPPPTPKPTGGHFLILVTDDRLNTILLIGRAR